jgi:hypothetical protein
MLCRFLARHGSLTVTAGVAHLRIEACPSVNRSRDLWVSATLPNTYKNSKPKSSLSVNRGPLSETPVEDEFFAPNEATFTALGITPAVSDALKRAGYTRPSAVQVITKLWSNCARRMIRWLHDCVTADDKGCLGVGYNLWSPYFMISFKGRRTSSLAQLSENGERELIRSLGIQVIVLVTIVHA